ncbi:hypothetical protein [Leptospira interrogans]|uniref:Uncharacterized protein n=1 Tax=Leptospira interrogans serovar Pyrogenes str. L0374 TaxID=1049928 RepID=M6KTF2_LEPIR|nr:hypothetical protein [Leptospira interrogans]EMN31067.1 hypothetical protein LEP1GSC083_2003 [Leptospira interrogans serovar Pyrogenes str. L0374]EMN94697.1 hypothetical protein LEP1GSC110_0017 [Leptospira interrogans serovar Medanensis str. UT053]
MLATKALTVRVDVQLLDRFDRVVKKARKTNFNAVLDNSIQNFIRRAMESELDKIENTVANSSKA